MVFALMVLSSALNASDPYGKDSADFYGKDGLRVTQDGAVSGWADKSLSIGEPVTVGGVTIYPVVDEDAPKHATTPLMGMSDAMAGGQLSVYESDSEGYTAVRMVNHAKHPVYVMAGEVIRGGRQDRMITEDIVLPPESNPLLVTVHCVEQGRWSDSAAAFTYGGRAEYALRDVLEKGGSQEETWAVVAALNTARSAAPSGAYVAAGGPEWLAYRQQLRAQLAESDQVVGAVVAHGGQLVHAEMFGEPAVAAVSRAVALDGYARDAVAMDSDSATLPDTDSVEAFFYQQIR